MNDQTPVAADHLQRAAERLARASDTPRLDAEVLLRHVLGTDRTGLILRLQSPVPVEAASAFEALVVARLGGQPVAYLTGHREFLGLDFAVGPGVLIPRPETELLVERALAWLSSRDTLAAGRPESTVRILDVGTGMGQYGFLAWWRGDIVVSKPKAFDVTTAIRG